MNEEARKLADRADHAVKALRGTDYKTLTPSFVVAQSLAEIIEQLLAAQPGSLAREEVDHGFRKNPHSKVDACALCGKSSADHGPSHEAGTQEPVAWRWRSIFNKEHWIVSTEKPSITNDQYILEPLYAASNGETKA